MESHSSERKMWHTDVKWQSDEIRAFSSTMLYVKGDKDMPEGTFSSEPTTFHIQGTLRVQYRHLKRGNARRWYQDLQLLFHTCITATATDYLSSGSLASFLHKVNKEPERCLREQLLNIYFYLQSSVCGLDRLYHILLELCTLPAPAANAVGGQQLPLHTVPQTMLCTEGGGRGGHPSSSFKDLALLKYHSMRGEAFVLGALLVLFGVVLY